MKKSAIYFLSLFLITFLACSDDSEEDFEISDDLEGGVPVNPTTAFPANFQATGSSANELLANTEFDAIRVEIAFVESQRDFSPTDEAIEAVENFLERFTFKDNIEFVFSPLASPEEEDFTLQEISDLEIENRTVYNDGTTLGVYIFFADAPSEGDDVDEGLVTLGAVYRNTSMVIYEETIRTLASRSALITTADVETATLNHEFGHLLGLVNLGTPAINDHEDTTTDENGNEVPNNHCNVENCLMLAQLEFRAASSISGATAKSGGLQSSCSLNGLGLVRQMEAAAARGAVIIPDLENECQLDLRSNGGRDATDI